MWPASLIVANVKSFVGSPVVYVVTYPAGMSVHTSLYHGCHGCTSLRSPFLTRLLIHSSLPWAHTRASATHIAFVRHAHYLCKERMRPHHHCK
jgi:hypothetical protein|eukprot:COSAG01_NODE_3355_length_6214_cov_2.843009_6_plen_93_part_00